jgi:hypothetical protein
MLIVTGRSRGPVLISLPAGQFFPLQGVATAPIEGENRMTRLTRAMLSSSSIAIVIALAASHADASVTEFTNFSQWQAAIGPHTTVDFTGYPEFTIITTQYSSLGVTFTDGNDFIFLSPDFQLDGAGLFGNVADPIRLSFSFPQTSIGVHYPSGIRYNLYSEGQLVYTSSFFFASFTGFAGLTSNTPFDSVVLINPLSGFAFIDNLYFGVPGPGALALMVVAAAWPGARRRRTSS